jgi:uncharacterized coiled-coil protein SlyX
MNTQIIGVLSAAAGSLIVFLFMRRAQLRGLNTTSDATIVTSAATLVQSLENQIQSLTSRLENLEKERNADRLASIAQLNIAHTENTRISAMVASLQTNLDIAQRQIGTLRQHLPNDVK